MTAVEERAPAKINLALHVTGRRPDGYHLLDSLVVFADLGDTISVRPSENLSLEVVGPRAAGVPGDGSNLVLRAAALYGNVTLALSLTKVLPAASGIGGGSADAAATLRAIARFTGRALPDAGAILGLGADVPACLDSRAVRMQGIGERLLPVAPLPRLPALLVNPGVEVATPAVFGALSRRDNPPMAEVPTGLATPGALASWLELQRNDLEPPALALSPGIGAVLAALRQQDGCLLARMSGSGATCFALFPDTARAAASAARLRSANPSWWIADCTLV